MTKKIKIEELFTAFQKFQSNQHKAIQDIRKPNTWQNRMNTARDEFKKDIGDLAKHIDWSE